MCVCERACVGVGGLAGGRELTASLLWPGLPSLCQFKLFMSGQWKEYSKIKNASGSGRAWILVQWKQPWEEGLPAWCPGVGWAAGGFRWGVFSCWLGSSSVDRASAEVRPPPPQGQAWRCRELHEEPGSPVRQAWWAPAEHSQSQSRPQAALLLATSCHPPRWTDTLFQPPTYPEMAPHSQV